LSVNIRRTYFTHREIGYSPPRLFRHAFSGRVAATFGLTIAMLGSVADAFRCTVLPRPRDFAHFARGAAVVIAEVAFQPAKRFVGYDHPTRLFSLGPSKDCRGSANALVGPFRLMRLADDGHSCGHCAACPNASVGQCGDQRPASHEDEDY
jgi:hypothetical protein